MKSDEKLLIEIIREAGLQLAEEKNPELQSLLGAALVRLTQEAARSRSYAAIQRSVEMIDYVEGERPGAGESLRPRIAVEDRLPEFIEESLRSGEVPKGLQDLLRRIPKASAGQIATRFSRAGIRQDAELLVSMMHSLGPEGLEHLQRQFERGSLNEAVDVVGILARLDAENLERMLPEKMREWRWTAHDRVVRQIAACGVPERGRLLLAVFDTLEATIRPLAIDEIGMAGEKTADMRLLRIAEGDIPRGSSEYLRLKAIEALGRLRTAGGEAILRKVASARKAWRWAHVVELRLVATQALRRIDPEWANSFIPNSGLNIAELSMDILESDQNTACLRQRRYPRLRLERPVDAATSNLKENRRLQIPEMALGGGVALSHQNLHPGSLVELRISGTTSDIKAQTVVRDANAQARIFEVVEIDLEDRARLRRLLVQMGNLLRESSPVERSRRSVRSFLAAS